MTGTVLRDANLGSRQIVHVKKELVALLPLGTVGSATLN